MDAGGTWDQRPGALEATRDIVEPSFSAVARPFLREPAVCIFAVHLGHADDLEPVAARELARQLVLAADVAEGKHPVQVSEPVNAEWIECATRSLRYEGVVWWPIWLFLTLTLCFLALVVVKA